MAKEIYIFAYGTLRPPREGSSPQDSRYHSQIEVFLHNSQSADLPQADLFDMGTYPAARPGEGVIHGDLLKLDPAGLEVIDRVEGHPVFYYREIVSVQRGDDLIEAWVYWAPEGLEHAGVPIATGDWFARPGLEHAEVLQHRSEAAIPQKASANDPALVAQIQRLAEAEAVWLTTVRPDGRPHSTPVWLAWHQGRIYVVAKPSSVKTTNLQDNSGVVVTLPDPMNALVVEGRATIVPAMRETIRPIFQKKYDWDIGTDLEYRSVIEITPYKLLAWGSKGEGRWTGPEIFSVDK